MADRALDTAGDQSARAMDILKRSGKAQTADNLNRAYLAQLHSEADSTAIPDMLDRAVNGGASPANRSRVRDPLASTLPPARTDEGNPAPVVTGNQVTGQAAPTTPSAPAPVTAPTTTGAPAAVPTANGTSIPLTAEDSAQQVDRSGFPVYPERPFRQGPRQDPTYSEDATQYGALPQQGPNLEAPSGLPNTALDRTPPGNGARYIPPAQTPMGAPVKPADLEAGGDPMRLEAPGETPMANPTAGASVPDISSPQTQALIQREAAKRGVDPAKIAEVLQQWQANPQMMQSQLSGMLGEQNNPGVSIQPPTDPKLLELDSGRANPTVSPLDLLGVGRVGARSLAGLAGRGVGSSESPVAASAPPAAAPPAPPAPANLDGLRQSLTGGTLPSRPTTPDHMPMPVRSLPSQPTTPGHIPRVPYQPNVPPVNPNPGPPLAGPGPQFSPARAGPSNDRLMEALRTGANARNSQAARDALRKQYGTPQ